jgi:phosphohistidine phosphatase SixA
VTVVLLRHAWAGHRESWDGDDVLRPLDERGRKQALALRGLDVDRIVSSHYVRCIETVVPLAATRMRTIEIDRRLAEGAGRSALELLAELDGGVACTHGDVVHDLLGRGLQKGEAAVVDVVGGKVRVVDLLDAP